MNAHSTTGTVLDRILESRRAEVEHRKKVLPKRFKIRCQSGLAGPRLFRCAFAQWTQHPRELKPASPSHGVLREPFDPPGLAAALESAGAVALSVLTESEFFRGSLKNLRDARKSVNLPILRKDFIFDPWQVWELARTMRTASCSWPLCCATRSFATSSPSAANLEWSRSWKFTRPRNSAALSPLAAASSASTTRPEDARRPRRDFVRMIGRIPEDCIAVSESGLRSHDDLQKLQEAGFDAFLIGEHLMLASDRLPRSSNSSAPRPGRSSRVVVLVKICGITIGPTPALLAKPARIFSASTFTKKVRVISLQPTRRKSARSSLLTLKPSASS